MAENMDIQQNPHEAPAGEGGIPVLALIKWLILVIGVGISLFHLYTGGFGVVEAYMQRTIHLMALMTLAFLIFPTHKGWSARKNALIDLPLALLCLYIGFYLLVHHDRIVGREWYYGPMTQMDIILGIVMIGITLEAARRVVGLALPVIAGFFIFYCLFGQQFPYPFRRAHSSTAFLLLQECF